MSSEAEYISPDGLLRFIIECREGEVALGFAGYEWHTHANLLAGSTGMDEQEAVTRGGCDE